MRRLLLVLCAALAACGDAKSEDRLLDATRAACAEMQANIEKLLGGKFAGPVPVEVVDIEFIAQFAADLEKKLFPPGLVETARRLSERMRLVPKGYDIAAAQIELIKLIVVGLYDPQKNRF